LCLHLSGVTDNFTSISLTDRAAQKASDTAIPNKRMHFSGSGRLSLEYSNSAEILDVVRV